MSAQSAMPSPVRAIRVLLFIMGFLTAMAALDAWLNVGGSTGLGFALGVGVPAWASFAAGWATSSKPSQRLRVAIIALAVCYVLWQLSRIAAGDPFGLLGLAIPIVLLILLNGVTARRYFRSSHSRNSRRRPGQRRNDRGSSSAEWVAIVGIATALVAALVATGVPGGVAEQARSSICRITGSAKCDEGDPRSGGSQHGPGGRGNPQESGGDDRWCWDWIHYACEAVSGVGLGLWDVGVDVVDGVKFVGCLLHICSHDGFKESWGGLGKLVTSPWESIQVMWDESTKPIREDWNNGHKVRAVFRTVPTILGTIFGGKGISKLGKIGKGGKAGDSDTPHNPVDNAPERLDPSQIPPQRTSPPVGELDLKKMEDEYKALDKRFGVEYMTAARLAEHRLVVHNGKLYYANGELFDTKRASTIHSGQGRAIFVMDRNGNIYASNSHEPGKLHHSSFLGGKPVASAGEITVENGVVKFISKNSGHYRPTPQYMRQFEETLKQYGLKLDNVGRDW